MLNKLYRSIFKPLFMRKLLPLSFILILLYSVNVSFAQSLSSKTQKMKAYEGYFDVYWEADKGKMYMKVDKWEEEFLLLESLPAGLGSNDIGLDRGQLGPERVVKFIRSGNKVMLIQPNYDFRANTDNKEEQQSVEEAFAKSVLWGFTVEAEEEGNVLIDVTNFCMQDMHGVAGRLRNTKQGNYSIDKSRSAFMLDGIKNFPENTELEVMLTFTGTPKGRYVRSVAPTASSLTVRSHYSFIKLPDADYQQRAFDPRYGYYGISYLDYATPLNEPIRKQFIARHRLKKANPNKAVSDPVEPIIYYLDPGTPEPIRSALLDGARWWADAFEAAGFSNAFKVEMLPKDADPMDVRYNVIQWVHRSTRGWSYGASVVDPRTGEIIKGHVSLGSLRARQDYLIAEGLVNPYKKGEKVSTEMQELALARLRQLSAHEVGHTLGLRHNFSASTNTRASVMDYPHPYIQLKADGSLDLSAAYDVGIGDWDKYTIKMGYQEFAKNEPEELNKMVANYVKEGYRFMSDADARPLGSANPQAHLWDNGKSAIDELTRLMNVRAKVIENFSEAAIPVGTPMSKLEEVFVPIYLMHRYQIEATSKVLGGLSYTYAVRGDGQMTTEIVAAEEQKKALDALLATITPEALAIPERILEMIPPRPIGYPKNRETFKGNTGLTFDPMVSVENAAHASISLLLHHERAARLIEYHARNAKNPDFHTVVGKLLNTTWKSKRQTGYLGAVQQVVERAVLYHLMKLASNKNAAEQVRAVAYLKLDELYNWLNVNQNSVKEYNQKAHFFYGMEQIRLFKQNPDQFYQNKPLTPPAGSPIGADFGCGVDGH